MHKDVLDTDVLKSIGRTGRYQLCQYALHFVSISTFVYVILGCYFIGRSVSHQCASLSRQSFSDILASAGIPGDNVVDSDFDYNECSVDVTITTVGATRNVTVDCLDGNDFGDLKSTSIVSEFDLVCSYEFLARLPLILILAATGIGCLIVPLIADKLGRKPVLITAQAASLLLSLAIAFTRSLALYTTLKTISGVFVDGIALISLTMAMEQTQPQDRKWIGFVFILAWVFHIFTLAGLAYVLRFLSWRFLQYWVAAVSLFVFINVFFLQESIAWLLAVGKEKEAVRLARFASKVNGLDPDKVFPRKPKEELVEGEEDASTSPDENTDATPTERVPASEPATDTSGETSGPSSRETTTAAVVSVCELDDEKKKGCLDFFTNRHLLAQLFIFIFLWTVAGFSYYGLYLNEKALTDGLFLNFIVNALPEIPAAIIFIVALDRIGRKKTLYIFLTIGVAFLLSSTLSRIFAGPQLQNILLPIFGILGKLGVTGTYFTLYFYTGETYPTSFRLLGLGTAALSGKLGSVAAPFLSFIPVTLPWLPTALIAGMLFVAIFVVIPLPETKGKALPMCIKEVDDLYIIGTS